MKQDSPKNFYEQLPVLAHFFEASDTSRYQPLPPDWFIAVTDIVNSTEAIAKDQYKRVNIIGASAIAGMLNVVNQDSIPFIFGGDGAIIGIPPDLYDSAVNVLASCRKVAIDAYDLNLRAALLPLSYVYQQGKEIGIAKFRVSDYYTQALFRGNGVRFVDEELKNDQKNQYEVEMAPGNFALANFSGLECRWKEVRIPDKEVITLLINKNPDAKDNDTIYSETLQKLSDIFGFDNTTNPIATDRLGMHLSWSELMAESRLRTFGMSHWQRIKYLLLTQIKIVLGKIFMRFDFKTSQTDWSRYKTDLVINSDYRKFDDMLRIVISGSREQRIEMEHFLKQKFEQSRLAYGMHITDAAMITCMVFRYQQEHIHFVDGSNGGYVMASRQLKKRMQSLRSN